MDFTLPQWIVDRPIAHRGLHDSSRAIPENSLAAFEAAAAAGHPAELDVRATRDGVPVVFHDVGLARLTGENEMIAGVDSASVSSLRLDGTEQSVPLLVDVLAAVAGRVPLLIEVKNDGVPGTVEEATLEVIADYPGEMAVQSFNPLTLQWFARNAPELSRGLLSGEFRGANMNPVLRQKLRDLEMIDVAAPHFIGYDVRFLPFERLTSLRAGGMPVLGWTVRSADEENVSRCFCENIIFEDYTPAR